MNHSLYMLISNDRLAWHASGNFSLVEVSSLHAGHLYASNLANMRLIAQRRF